MKQWTKREEGSALAMVLIALLFITILSTSVFMLSQTNTRQVVSQDNGIDSYYIARSGVEATFQALLVIEPSLLTQFSGASTTVLQDQIVFAEGVADIRVEGFTENSVRRIRITSSGVATGTNVIRRSIMEFNLNDYGNIKWSR